MEFRWLVAITLYTLLVGPVVDAPPLPSSARPAQATPARALSDTPRQSSLPGDKREVPRHSKP